jgi:hypothetical protein
MVVEMVTMESVYYVYLHYNLLRGELHPQYHRDMDILQQGYLGSLLRANA